MYSESDLLPISALQHIVFCERQCALIHIERLWAENRLTAEGKILHERTDREEVEVRGNCRISRGLLLHCMRLGIHGRADVVEFHKTEDNGGVSLAGVKGKWLPYPVEYKRGKPKIDRCDEVQLCAQALCLEEMLKVEIVNGALYYGTPRRRTEITIDQVLRSETEKLSKKLHQLIDNKITPHAAYEKKCVNCSLLDLCLPKLGNKNNVEQYLNDTIDLFTGDENETSA